VNQLGIIFVTISSENFLKKLFFI